MTETDHLHEVKKYHVTGATALSKGRTLITNMINTVESNYASIVTTGEGVDVVVTIDIAVIEK